MPIPLSITDLSATPASNSPQGTEPMGTNADDYIRSHAAIIRQIYDAIVGGTVVNLVPTGTVIMNPTFDISAGYLPCQGQAVSRSTYSALFAKWGTAFGVGDGSTTFNLLDMRGVFPRGLDNGRGLDPNRAVGSLQGNQMPAHVHTASASTPVVSINGTGDHAHNYTIAFNAGITVAPAPATSVLVGTTNASTSPAGAHSHTATATAPTITVAQAGAGSESRPVNVAFLFLVKT